MHKYACMWSPSMFVSLILIFGKGVFARMCFPSRMRACVFGQLCEGTFFKLQAERGVGGCWKTEQANSDSHSKHVQGKLQTQ